MVWHTLCVAAPFHPPSKEERAGGENDNISSPSLQAFPDQQQAVFWPSDRVRLL